MSLGSNIVVPAATSGDPSSGVDLVNVQITQAAPFPASLLETMSTEADPTVLANLLQRYTLCVARISTALISPHLHQRPLVQSHVDKLEALYGDLGPDLTEVSNYGYVVATDPRWIQYSHNSRDYITVHEGSRMTVDCLRGGHRIAAVNQWAEHHELPEFRYWVVYVLRPGTFILNTISINVSNLRCSFKSSTGSIQSCKLILSCKIMLPRSSSSPPKPTSFSTSLAMLGPFTPDRQVLLLGFSLQTTVLQRGTWQI